MGAGDTDREDGERLAQTLKALDARQRRPVAARASAGRSTDRPCCGGRYYEYYEIEAHGGARPNEDTLTSAEFLLAQEQR
ncbi:hypothetical protein BX265_7841 [Streptomyces sp. TLI_235]|nr:hypothetical protein [Streptomyces sp. TLI_235]PBC70421.1 hypothetical protein BX265_7841 [Streptomyces sp. TLI_235]